MTDLVFKSPKGNPVTTSLIVAEMFEKNHRHVLEAIRNLITTAENPAVLKMFYESTYKNYQNKKQPMFYMNRDGFSLLVMGFTGEKALKFKISFIEAFNTLEKKLHQAMAVPTSFAEALELAAHQARELEAKDKQLAIQAPKVSFADRVIDLGNLVDIGQAAKLLKLSYGRNTLFQKLREMGVFFKNRNEPKQEFIERGYFELRENEIKRDNHPSMMVTKVLVTQTGLFWLSKTFSPDEKTLPLKGKTSIPKLNPA